MVDRGTGHNIAESRDAVRNLQRLAAVRSTYTSDMYRAMPLVRYDGIGIRFANDEGHYV